MKTFKGYKIRDLFAGATALGLAGIALFNNDSDTPDGLDEPKAKTTEVRQSSRNSDRNTARMPSGKKMYAELDAIPDIDGKIAYILNNPNVERERFPIEITADDMLSENGVAKTYSVLIDETMIDSLRQAGQNGTIDEFKQNLQKACIQYVDWDTQKSGGSDLYFDGMDALELYSVFKDIPAEEQLKLFKNLDLRKIRCAKSHREYDPTIENYVNTLKLNDDLTIPGTYYVAGAKLLTTNGAHGIDENFEFNDTIGSTEMERRQIAHDITRENPNKLRPYLEAMASNPEQMAQQDPILFTSAIAEITSASHSRYPNDRTQAYGQALDYAFPVFAQLESIQNIYGGIPEQKDIASDFSRKDINQYQLIDIMVEAIRRNRSIGKNYATDPNLQQKMQESAEQHLLTQIQDWSDRVNENINAAEAEQSYDGPAPGN